MMTLEIPVCEVCGRTVFPERLLCPECGARAFRHEPVTSGVLEAVSERGEVSVGAVRTPLGPLAIARVVGDAKAGDEVLLSVDDGVPVAST